MAITRLCSDVVGPRGCTIGCPGGGTLTGLAPTEFEVEANNPRTAYAMCCEGNTSKCGKDTGSSQQMGLTTAEGGTIFRPPLGGRRPSRTGGMAFRGADGKLLEGKQEILGVELPKVLVVAGVAVAAYFIVKKMK
tara:strand:- start:353 stop:757 length:405 start_codon:yes stop_codon:yes gene_type:complete